MVKKSKKEIDFSFMESRGISSERLKEVCEDKNFDRERSNGSFIMFNEKTLRFYYGACHASLNRWFNGEGHVGEPVSGVLTQVFKDNAKTSLNYRWWLANESPWANAYLSKESDFIEKYGLITDPEGVPNGLFQAANILARSPNEFRERVRFWNLLVDKYSVDPLEAFFTTTVLSINKDNKAFIGMWEYHSATYSLYFTKDAHNNLVSKTYDKNYLKSFNERGRYGEVFALLGYKDRDLRGFKPFDNITNYLTQNLSSFQKTVYKVCAENPFGKKVSNLVEWRKDNQIEILEKDLKEASSIIYYYLFNEA